MLIRPYDPSDCRELTELFYNTVHQINAKDYTKEQLDAWASGEVDLDKWNQSLQEHCSYVAIEDGTITGFGDIDKTGYLDRLYVHKDHQGQGVATALCDALEKTAPGDITVHASITARAFFEKRGYQVLREQQVERRGISLTNFVCVKRAPDTPQLETRRLLLRKFTEQDLAALFAIYSDVEANKHLPWFPLKTLEEAAAFWKERYQSACAGNRSYRYAICLKEDNVPIGYMNVSTDDSHDFGYGLRKEFWHRGIATEAGKALIQRLIADGFPYITATHDINNPRSGQVMRNLGMQYRYSYEELWQPKDILVTFRMYQLNFTAPKDWVYRKYWEESKVHFVETNFPHSEKGRLAIEQFRIQAAFLHQLGMGAVFHYIPFGENEDAVGELAASQSVGDEKGYGPLGNQVIFLVQLIFNLGIQGRRGLVQDLRLAGPVQGACDGNLRLCGLSPQNTDMPVIPKQPGKSPWPSA